MTRQSFQIRDNTMKFEKLADSIKNINDKAGSTAKSAVNQLMTLRNWAIGYYIVEYEQAGSFCKQSLIFASADDKPNMRLSIIVPKMQISIVHIR